MTAPKSDLEQALDAYVAALLAPDTADRARSRAWNRCAHLGATRNDYVRARQQAETRAQESAS